MITMWMWMHNRRYLCIILYVECMPMFTVAMEMKLVRVFIIDMALIHTQMKQNASISN